MSKTYVRFERRLGDEVAVTLGPFDWIEVEGDTMRAEAQDGEVRHDPLALLTPEPNNFHWTLEDRAGQWHYFVVYERGDNDE